MSVLQTVLAHPYLVGSGVVLIIAGLLLCRWAGQYDLKGLATEAAIQVAWNKGDLNTETELGNRLKALKEEGSNLKRAQTVAGHATRHVLSRFVNMAGMIAIAAGIAMIAATFYWR